MVMPRSRSSGALSIWSKAMNWASLRAASTLVIAAVSVVLPWSIWPIVPTFACGLLRSNLALPMVRTSAEILPALGARAFVVFAAALHQFRVYLLRHRFIGAELHRVSCPPLGHRAQARSITEHRGQRHAR